jgi:hypothetical protein
VSLLLWLAILALLCLVVILALALTYLYKELIDLHALVMATIDNTADLAHLSRLHAERTYGKSKEPTS